MLALACAALPLGVDWGAVAGQEQAGGDPPSEQAAWTARGRVVWLTEALRRSHGVESTTDADQGALALEDREGRLWVLVEDVRGGAFRKDPRLRELADVELLAKTVPGPGLLRIVKLYCWEDGHRWQVDYWCDICAIAIHELRPCDCCQGPLRLRKELADPD